MTIDEWIKSIEGKTIDVDHAYGGQCWDLWSHYAQHVYNVPQRDTNTTDGYAASVYLTKYAQDTVLQRVFSKKPASYTPVKGDVAFWKRAGMNHVAIVLKDNGNTVHCVSQNPNKAKAMNIGKNGIIGYLHPRVLDKTAAGVTTRKYTVNVTALNVRDRPSTSGRIVATYRRGETVNLASGTIIADGYEWAHYTGASGKTRYLAYRPANGTPYLK